MLCRQGMGSRKCPGLGSATAWLPWIPHHCLWCSSWLHYVTQFAWAKQAGVKFVASGINTNISHTYATAKIKRYVWSTLLCNVSAQLDQPNWGSGRAPAALKVCCIVHARKRICLQHFCFFWFFGQHLFIYSFTVFIMTSDKMQIKLQ